MTTVMAWYRTFKKTSPLRRVVPPRLAKTITRLENRVLTIRRRNVPVAHQSRYRLLIHVGVQKTGTVWFRDMFRDLKLYQYSGRDYVDASERCVCPDSPAGIYAPVRKIDEELLLALEQPDASCVAVMRNPASLVQSWISSTSNYHIAGGNDAGLSDRRQTLRLMDFDDQVRFAVNYLANQGRFDQQELLLKNSEHNKRLLVVKYEDCLSTPEVVFSAIFEHLDIAIPQEDLKNFIARHSFAAYLGKRSLARPSATSALQGTASRRPLSAAHLRIIYEVLGTRIRSLYFQ